MPPAYDIYVNQLRVLGKGLPLYHPEPHEEGPIEIGDVGYVKEGSFYRLFNVSRSGNDPAQSWGVPEGFEPLHIGRIRTFDAELEPGPLHSETIFQVSADVGTSGAVLPADAFFNFSCTSSQGAILMLETEMNRQVAIQSVFFRMYTEKHCLSWYAFARGHGIQVDFGDIMLVTGCSKTAAWASAVYSQSSTEFGISFSAGGAFLPSLNGVAVTTDHERIGPVENRRSQRHGMTLLDLQGCPKNHTVFIQAYHLGFRKLYTGSVAQKVRKTMDRLLRGRNKGDSPTPSSSSSAKESSHIPASPSIDGSSDTIDSNESMMVTMLSPERPDFQPAVALLAQIMETTDVEIAVVHDDEWCSTPVPETTRIIDQYAQCFFDSDVLDDKLDRKFGRARKESRDDSPERSIFWLDLGNVSLSRFKPLSFADINTAIPYYEKTLVLRSPESHERFMFLSSLGSALLSRFEQLGNMEDLEVAIQHHQDVLASYPTQHPDRSMFLSNFGSMLLSRFKQLGRMADLELAVRHHQDALASCPTKHPDRSMFLSNLGSVFISRFEQLGNMRDLALAIRHHQCALTSWPSKRAGSSMLLRNLGKALLIRFGMLGRMGDLEQAVRHHQDALSCCSTDNSSGYSMSLNGFAIAMLTRFKHSGRMNDHHKAVLLLQEAFAMRPPGHPLRSASLNNLGRALMERYEWQDRMDDLNQAIIHYEGALALRPSGHPDRPLTLNNCGNALLSRFKRLGRLEDINKAIMLQREALELCPAGHPSRAVQHSNLAVALHFRFNWLGQSEDLEEAIMTHREALAMYPVGRAGHYTSLCSLAHALSTRFEQRGMMRDIEEAIAHYQTALLFTPPVHVDRLLSLNNLASALCSRFKKSGAMKDREHAISLYQEAFDLCPPGHPLRSVSYKNLSNAVQARFGHWDMRGY